MDQVDEVKNKLDIVDVIRERVSLKKAGKNFKGLCPFHSEDTPSFMVSPELQIYKCFGCGEGGDVISFIQKFEGLEFYETLKLLADKAGIKLKPISGQAFSEKDELYRANELAVHFYHYILTTHSLGKPFLKYAKKERNISSRSIKTFLLGAAPERPKLLFNYLTQKKGFSPKTLEKAGLVVETQRGYIDRFRGRLIFPIHTHTGRPVALAGRILPGRDKIAKYINSPETPIYHKSSSLYGLNLTRSEIKKADKAIVVEGELDLISTWGIGITNIVAIKGTALTEEQIRILSRFASSIVLALDSDFAGDKAAIRGFILAQKIGLDVSVAALKKYKDPDDYAKADPEGLKKILSSPVPIWDFLINATFAKYKKIDGSTKGKISRELTPWLSSIPDSIVKAHYIKVLANRLDVPQEAVLEEINSAGSSPSFDVSLKTKKFPKQKSRRELLERDLLSLVLNTSPNLLIKNGLKKYFQTPLIRKITTSVIKILKKNPKTSLTDLKSALPPELQEGFINITFTQEEFDDVNVEKELNLLIKEIETINLKKQLNLLSKKITSLEKQKKPRLLKKKQQEFTLLSNKLAKLEV